MGGIGIIIILFQWHSFFGEKTPGKVLDIISHLPDPIIHHHWSAIILGGVTLFLIYTIPLISKKIPAGLIALILGTLASLALKEYSFIGDWHFDTIGNIPNQLARDPS